MGSTALYYVYATVMIAALYCFVRAWQTRFVTPIHKRFALWGVGLNIGGVLAVIVAHRMWGWVVEHRIEDVVTWHRRLAYVSSALIILIAITGALRMSIHKRLYIIFFPLYIIVLVTALIGYKP